MRYGRGELRLLVPAENVAGVFRPRSARGEEDSPRNERAGPTLVSAALASAAGPMSDLLSGRRVALLISDATREEPREPILRAVAPSLKAARERWLVVATGSHDPRSPATLDLAREIEGLLASCGAGVSRVIVHDAVEGPFASLGRTSSGTLVRLNALAMDADAFVVLSDMKHHYFAGYSCPPKFVFPGLAEMESIEANHAYTLDPSSRAGFHPWHPDPRRRANPLAADYVEAYELAVAGRPAFALTFGSSGGEIFWAEAAPLPEATARGIARADEIGHVVTAPARFAVISPGGYPNDVDLYIAQRALELCGASVEDGGDILFLCECSGGIGPARSLPAFWDPLRGSLREAASTPGGRYRLYSHKAVRFARLILRLSALHLHTSLPADEVASAHMVAVTDPQAVIGEWLAMEPDARILLFDGANKLSVSLP